MMGDNVVNLRMARKRKTRAERAAQGAQMRAKHGRTKVERLADDALRDRQEQQLDSHRLRSGQGPRDDA